MDPHLRKLQEKIATAIRGLSAEELNRKSPGKWCAGEILEHLYLSFTGTTKGLERMVEAGGPITAPSTWRQRAQKVVVLGFSYLPSGREAPKFLRPRGLPLEKVLAEIGSKIAEMDEVITRCEKSFGVRRRLLDHAILGPCTGSQWRKFHLVHGEHHLRQIRRLRGGGNTG